MASDPRVLEWRRKALDGVLTLEEQTAAIAVLREGREAARPKVKEPKPTYSCGAESCPGRHRKADQKCKGKRKSSESEKVSPPV